MVELFYIYVGYCGAMSRQDNKLSFICVAQDHNSSDAMLGLTGNETRQLLSYKVRQSKWIWCGIGFNRNSS